MTTSSDPSSEFLRKRRLLAPESVAAFAMIPSGSRTFAAAVM